MDLKLSTMFSSFREVMGVTSREVVSYSLSV